MMKMMRCGFERYTQKLLTKKMAKLTGALSINKATCIKGKQFRKVLVALFFSQSFLSYRMIHKASRYQYIMTLNTVFKGG